MKKEKAKELSLILNAYSEGKTIQIESAYGWSDLRELVPEDLKLASMEIKGRTLNYRIKPQQKLVPFTFEDNHLFRDKWVRRKSSPFHIQRISIICENYVGLEYKGSITYFQYDGLLSIYEFEDGSPFGKYVEE